MTEIYLYWENVLDNKIIVGKWFIHESYASDRSHLITVNNWMQGFFLAELHKVEA